MGAPARRAAINVRALYQILSLKWLQQTLQVSRILRETHAFWPNLCVSRRETKILTPIAYRLYFD